MFWLILPIIIFATLGSSIKVGQTLFGQAPLASYYGFALLTSLVHLIEYLPVLLFMAFYEKGVRLVNSGQLNFFHGLGHNFYGQQIRKAWLFGTINVLLVLVMMGQLIPGFFTASIETARDAIFEAVLEKPGYFLKKGHINKVANYHIAFENFTNSRWQFTLAQPTVFVAASGNHGLQKLIQCSSLQYNRRYKRLTAIGCHHATVANLGKSQYHAKVILDKRQLRQFYNKYAFTKTVTSRLPAMIKKYLQSSKFLGGLFQKNRILNSLRLADDILYLLMALLYLPFGLTLGLRLAKKPALQRFLAPFVFALLLPALAVYFRLQTSNPLPTFTLTYFWPLVGILLYQGFISRDKLRTYFLRMQNAITANKH